MKTRKLMTKDVEGILNWMKDPEINRFFRMDADGASKETVLRFIEMSQEQVNNIHLAVTDDDDNYLGTVSLKNINRENQSAEYAISMCKLSHGTGASQFATEEILKLGFEVLGLHRIYLNVLSENYRANKFYQKCNFVYEGEFKEAILIRGEFKDLKWYRILKKEYEELNKEFNKKKDT